MYLRYLGVAITTHEIIYKAIELMPSLKIKKYKTLCKWYQRYLNRNGFSYRNPTNIGQKPKEDAIDQLMNFLIINISIRKKFNILDEQDLCRIGNVDEAPIVFKMFQKKTIEKIGNKTVTILTFCTEKAKTS